MNYIQLLIESLRICRATKLVWVIEWITLLITITNQPLLWMVRGNLLTSVFWILVYLEFTKQISYPALVKQQKAA